jgi:hypothetical protein
MNEKMLISQMIEGIERVPESIPVLEVRRFSIDELQTRASKFLALTGEVSNRQLEHGDWITQGNKTLINLPYNAHAVIHHASGAMHFDSGLAPMEELFGRIYNGEPLQKMVEETAYRFNLDQWAGKNGALRFEKLWQIKASAVNREGLMVQPVLCRVVGTYRHFIDEIPVFGPASVTVKLAHDGILDAFSVHVREITGEIIDEVPVLQPEVAARQISLQLRTRMGKSVDRIEKMAKVQWMNLGYMSLPKHKSQRLLAPVYVAAIEISGKEMTSAHLLVTPASEKMYFELPSIDVEPVRPERVR